MASNSLVADTSKIASVFPQLKNDLISTLKLEQIDIDNLHVSYFHILFLVIFLGMANYISFTAAALLRFRIVSVVLSIIFPVTPILGCLFLFLFAYASSCIYAFLLSDARHCRRKYMYVCLLASILLPPAIAVANLFGSLLISFGILGLFSDYTCRRCLTLGRHFEDRTHWLCFIAISLLFNLGVYTIIFPMFYMR